VIIVKKTNSHLKQYSILVDSSQKALLQFGQLIYDELFLSLSIAIEREYFSSCDAIFNFACDLLHSRHELVKTFLIRLGYFDRVAKVARCLWEKVLFDVHRFLYEFSRLNHKLLPFIFELLFVEQLLVPQFQIASNIFVQRVRIVQHGFHITYHVIRVEFQNFIVSLFVTTSINKKK